MPNRIIGRIADLIFIQVDVVPVLIAGGAALVTTETFKVGGRFVGMSTGIMTSGLAAPAAILLTCSLEKSAADGAGNCAYGDVCTGIVTVLQNGDVAGRTFGMQGIVVIRK